jgi:hypothetical protein
VPDAHEINLNNRVITADGHDIGRVKQIAESCFEVDVSLHHDYWINAAEIESSKGNTVHVRLLKAGLDGVEPRVDPAHEGAHLHA